MVIWGLILLILACNFISFCFLYKDTNIIKMSLFSVASLFIIYAIISGIMFGIDSFSFEIVLLLECIISLGAVLILLIKNKFKIFHFNFVQKCDFALLLILIVFTAFSGVKFELFSTGQDEGLYQAEAIELYKGNYEVQHDFEEYSILEDEKDKNAYRNMVNSVFTGFYASSTSQWVLDNEKGVISDVSGMYHGIQTFPAMLALGGKLFGFNNMLYVQTIFYICAIGFLYYALYEIKIKYSLRIFMVCMFAMSPLVLWISKASYTEMFLTMLMCMYVYLLVESRNKTKWLLSLPLVSFAFVHVSYLILLPIFIVLNLVNYIMTNNRQYLFVNIVSAAGFWIGYLIMSIISPTYFYYNCSRLYIGEIVTKSNFLIYMFFLSAAIIVMTFIIYKSDVNKLHELLKKINKFNWIAWILGISVLFFAGYGIYVGYFGDQNVKDIPWLYAYYGSGFRAFFHLSIVSLVMATGCLIVPVIYYTLLRKAKIIVKNDRIVFSVVLLLIYIIVVECIIVKPEVSYYFYYSRYLVHFIPILIVVACICMKDWKPKVRTALFIISVGIMLVFDQSIIINKDDTLWEWETLEDLSEAIEKDSAVIIANEKLQNLLGPQLRAAANVAIFPVFDDLDKEISFLSQEYMHVYYLADDASGYSDSNQQYIQDKNRKLDIIYRDRYIYSKDAVNVQRGYFPLAIEQVKKEMILYEIDAGTIFFNELGLMNATRNNECITSTGKEGVVCFGPYVSLSAGKYHLKVPFEVIECSDQNIGYFQCYKSGDAPIVNSMQFSKIMKNENERNWLDISFVLENDVEKLEFVFYAYAGSKFKIYPYLLKKVDM